jgi:ComF family protein
VKTQFIQDFTHLFFPHICAGCGTDVIGAKSVLCIKCVNQLPKTNFHLHAENQVEKIFRGRLPVKLATSFCYFSKDSLIQRLLHQLKYKGNKEVGYFAGRMMGLALRESELYNCIDALIPLPLFASREKKRGYNQAAILCEGISSTTGIPVLKNIITRTSSTETQTNKNRIERWLNMEGRFELTNPEAVMNKHVLLVDDVLTTGATLEACGMELLKGENTAVSISTLAFTVK